MSRQKGLVMTHIFRLQFDKIWMSFRNAQQPASKNGNTTRG